MNPGRSSGNVDPSGMAGVCNDNYDPIQNTIVPPGIPIQHHGAVVEYLMECITGIVYLAACIRTLTTVFQVPIGCQSGN